MKVINKSKGYIPTPILKRLSMLLTYRNFLSLFNYQTIRPAGIGVSLHSKRGYTLIEIVVVISIMAVMTTIIYSSFDTSRAKSRDQKRISDISTIQIALEQYFQKNGIYPLTLNLLIPTYISSIPTDPTTNLDFSLNYFPISKGSSSNYCVSYQLWTKFEQNNTYLGSKKGFDSTLSLLPNNMFECGSSHSKINATTGTMVYDVMP